MNRDSMRAQDAREKRHVPVQVTHILREFLHSHFEVIHVSIENLRVRVDPIDDTCERVCYVHANAEHEHNEKGVCSESLAKLYK